MTIEVLCYYVREGQNRLCFKIVCIGLIKEHLTRHTSKQRYKKRLTFENWLKYSICMLVSQAKNALVLVWTLFATVLQSKIWWQALVTLGLIWLSFSPNKPPSNILQNCAGLSLLIDQVKSKARWASRWLSFGSFLESPPSLSPLNITHSLMCLCTKLKCLHFISPNWVMGKDILTKVIFSNRVLAHSCQFMNLTSSQWLPFSGVLCLRASQMDFKCG